MAKKTMKQAIISGDLSVTIESNIPIPEPAADEVVIRAVYSGINPIDWKGANAELSKALHGDVENPDHGPVGKDFAGYVYAVEAATFGLPYLTAALLMFKGKPLPTPWNPAPGSTRTPLLVYGASSAVGAFAVKLAKLANIHPIIAVAGASSASIEKELKSDLGDVLLDYRQDPAKLLQNIKDIADDIHYAADAIGSPETAAFCAQAVNPTDSTVTSSVGDPWDNTVKDHSPVGVEFHLAFSPGVFEPNDPEGPEGKNSPNLGPKAFATIAMAYLSYALQRRLIKPHPYEVQPEGLGSLSRSLTELKEGRSRGLRYVLEIAASSGFAKVGE
ncbi:hypothetical protein LTR22_002834 [Elasticomyces elasticus]|nr:hypothetical protein LTR22_002834 [Elasticomyces elasticus]KAK4910344.1 hypothetical protein LTR49_020951 [Elasticomyces elasticus]KAK5763602.1 hypothetical protein LTS12_006159 [Elasticomyces elasticus]